MYPPINSYNAQIDKIYVNIDTSSEMLPLNCFIKE